MKYNIKKAQDIVELNLEGKRVRILTKQNEEIEDIVFYQGDLDWEKLNSNLGTVSIGYNYLSFDNFKDKVKYEDILSIDVL